jgi:hypothetical protein
MLVSGQFYAAAAYPRYPLDGRLGGLQSRCGRGDENETLSLPGIEPLSSSP